MNGSVRKFEGLNTIVFPWHFYKDFGAFGVLFLPLLVGMIITVFLLREYHERAVAFKDGGVSTVAPLIIFQPLGFAL